MDQPEKSRRPIIRPALLQFAALDKAFVGRYLAVKFTWKALTGAEAHAISNAGLYIISIWEDGAADTPAYFTYDQGNMDGYNAFNLAADLGQPYGAVYFAVDFDATMANQAAVLDYFRGVYDGYQRYAADRRRSGEIPIPCVIGAYGSYDVLTWLQQQGIVRYFYQAYATHWSNGRNANAWPGYNVRQTGINQSLCTVAVDPDESGGTDGGWHY